MVVGVRLFRWAAVIAVTVLGCPAAPAGAIQPPVVAPGPAPADPAPGPDQPMHQVEECTQTTVVPGTDLREPLAAWRMLDMAAAWRISTGAGVVVGVIDTGVGPSPRLPHLVAGGDYVMGRYGDGLADCDGHGTAVASLIGAAPGGARLPSRPQGAPPALPPAGAPPPAPVPAPAPPPTVTVTATVPPPPPPPPPPPEGEGEAPAWGEPVKAGPPGGGFSLDDPPPVTAGGGDGFLGGAPDVVMVSARQSSRKFALAQPKVEQDPERARRAGDVHTLAESIVHMANMGVKVLNISVVACQSVANLINDAEIGAAVRYAAADRDVLIVSAAGNNDESEGCTQNPDPSPADPAGWDSVQTIVTPGWYCDYVLTVSATDNQGVPLSGQAASMHGPWISLAAPGADIVALSTDGRVVNASVDTRNNSIKPLAGSSFAAGIVSSVAALVRAKFPQLSAYQVRHRLEASAHPPPAGHDSVVGYGVVNPVGALTWDIPAGEQFPPGRVTTATMHPPPPPAPADPRPGRAVLWGGLAGLATAGAVVITIVVRRRREAS